MNANNANASNNTFNHLGLGITLAILAALGFSFKAILIKLAYPYGVTAVPLLMLRMLFSLPVFLYVAWRESRTSTALTIRQWGNISLLGMLGYYGASLFDFLGLKYISAGLERMILFTYPMLTVLIGITFLGRKWKRNEVIALILSYLGIGLAVGHDINMSSSGGNILIGGGWVFLSALCYAAYLAGGGQMIAQLGASRFTSIAMLISTLVVVIHFMLTEAWSALIVPWQVYALAFAMAVFSTILPVYMLASSIEKIGSERAAVIGSLGPILTIGLGVMILNESFSLIQLVGVILVVGGVRMASR